MIKYRLIFLISFFLSGILFAQYIPNSFKLYEENKLFKSSSEETPASNSVTDIISIGDTVWIGTGKGVSLSTDNGETWTNFTGGDVFGDENIASIGYKNGVFWASTAHNTDQNGQSLPEGSGFKYTTDNGLTWSSIPQPLDDPNDTIVVYGINNIRALPVTVAIQNLAFDIAFTKGTVWSANFAGGLRKSTDNGKTWQRVVLPPDNLDSISPTDTLNFALQPVAGKFGPDNNLNHRVFSVVSANDSTLYVGTAGGINKSTDNGISWKKFNHQNQSNPISGNFIVALGYNKNNNSVWAASWKAEGETEFFGVSSSFDGGANWSTFLNGERVHNFAFKSNQVIAPADNGAFRTTNSGTSWIVPSSIVDSKSGLALTTNTFFSAAAQNASLRIFLGTDQGLVMIDEIGIWSGSWKLKSASEKIKSNGETFAYPNPFTPRLEQVKIKYSTGGKNESVTIRIFDFGMNLVRTVIQNAQRGNGVHVVEGSKSSVNGVIDFWDGRDDSGNIVPNGVYFYRVEVGNNSPVYGKIMVLQ